MLQSSFTDRDVRELLEVMHKKRMDATVTLQNLFKNLKMTCANNLTLAEFCNWTTANPSALSPLLILQVTLRKKLISEVYWMRMTAERIHYPELGE